MSKQVVSEIASVEAFFSLLQNNPGLIIIKLGAEWCGPCKTIEPLVYELMSKVPATVKCAALDIDEEANFDLYAFLKSKKMVNGVPVILFYKMGNKSWVPNDVVVGANPGVIRDLFQKYSV
jgi:thiol-disulfide isomerase/thioredoxin